MFIHCKIMYLKSLISIFPQTWAYNKKTDDDLNFTSSCELKIGVITGVCFISIQFL